MSSYFKMSPNFQLKVLHATNMATEEATEEVAKETKKALSVPGFGKPSTPPDPPHLQTGNLREGILGRMEKRTMHSVKYRVYSTGENPETQFSYGKMHEFGFGKFPKRSFLKRSLINSKLKILEAFGGMLRKYGRS